MTYASLLKENTENLQQVILSGFRNVYGNLPLDDLLVRISEAYCKIKQTNQPSLNCHSERVKFREEIYAWYIQTYTARAQQKGKQGAHRGMSQRDAETDYCFDHLYDKAQFKRFVFDGIRPPAEFVMHMAVAFKMSVAVLNALLRQYGYLPLHVKNIHHLAIGSVLSICDPQDENYSQFHLIKQRYFDALIRITATQFKQQEQSMATTVIREELSSLENLNDENYCSFIDRFAAELNWRHSAILAEHARLTRVFADLYEGRRKGMHWEPDTMQYSLAGFVERFCKPISLKRFNDNLIHYIRDGGKHPTRESMILLWLYAECHHGHIIENCPSKYIHSNGLSEYCDEMRSAETVEGVLYQCCSFSIHRYLYPGDEAPRIWDGTAVLHRINSYLLRYDWGVLNEKHSFDRVIQQLLKLRIEKSADSKDKWVYIRYNGEAVCKIDSTVVNDSVPLPLCVICEILSLLRGKMGKSIVDPKLTSQLKIMLRELHRIAENNRSMIVAENWTECLEYSRKLLSKNCFLCSEMLSVHESVSGIITSMNVQAAKEMQRCIVKLHGKLADALPYPLQCDLYEQL